MRTVASLAWATLERGAPRLAAALIMLAFARLTDPATVGIYGWTVLAYTFYSGAAESVVRNRMLMAIGHPEEVAEARKLGQHIALLGAALISAALVLLGITYGHIHGEVVISLTPMCLVPFITSSGIRYVAVLEVGQKWGTLARAQFTSAVVGLAIALVVLLPTQSALAMALNSLAAEGTFRYLCARASARTPIGTRNTIEREPNTNRNLTLLGTLTWAQNQLERTLIGLFGGPASLGIYSTAWAVGRSPGDALAMATANYLRAASARHEIDPEPDNEERRIRRIGSLAVLTSLAMAIVVTAASKTILLPILGPQWEQIIEIVPLMAFASLSYAISSSLILIAAFHGQTSATITPTLVGVAFAVLIGFTSLHSLQYAALMVVFKEAAILLAALKFGRAPGAKMPAFLAIGLAIPLALTVAFW